SKHLDIFFEQEKSDLLKTYESDFESWEILETGGVAGAISKEDHRLIYLDYEGIVSNNRGEINILWKGRYNPPEVFEKKIRFKMEKELLVFV
ncbi:MAG: hypothetical protein K8R21_09960, partial [Leptospira sp.]|nr:hypothetical protein [Leptospira sp.]